MISIGFDIGTTTLRAVAVELTLGPFRRKSATALGRSLVQWTPYQNDLLDQTQILRMLTEWVGQEKLPPPEVGTLLFTGQAQRAPNVSHVAQAITERWEGLVSAQLDPELETRVAAHGAGAVELSRQRIGQPVLHIDVGGGTSNLAWIENGVIEDTACWDLGARKWRLTPEGFVLAKTKQAGQLESLFPDIAPRSGAFSLELAKKAALRLASLILDYRSVPSPFLVVPWKHPKANEAPLLSLSGGIVECLRSSEEADFRFGDLGPFLGKSIVEEAKARGWKVHLSLEHGRATALGVSSHSFQVSGASIFSMETQKHLHLPLFQESEPWAAAKFAIAVSPVEMESAAIKSKALGLAERLKREFPAGNTTIVFVLASNLGKTLGHFLKEQLDSRFELVVIDEIENLIPKEASARTVDLRWSESAQRYTLTVKALHLF